MPVSRCRLLLCLTACLIATPGTGLARPGAPAVKPEAPKTIEPFTLTDTVGQPWTLPDGKAAVVVFTGTVCPINESFVPTLARLHQEYSNKGVVLVAINSNAHEDAARVAAHAKQHALPFPVLKDTAGAVADRFGAEHTPEAFLLDTERRVRYRGRIDDQFGFDYKRPKPTRRDLAEAIEEVLAGKPVSVPVTPVEGCMIARPAKPKADATVTYSKQIAHILQKNCQECHRPGQVGPMPLTTYTDAAAWASTIRMVVRQGRMPPWHADPSHGKFQNTRGLSDADRQTLLTWIDEGCPEGDPKDLPPAKQFAEGWTIGKPDAVFTMPVEYKVPAETPRGGIPYKYFTVETNFDRDMWVQAAEARPGAREVVHHIIVYAVLPSERRQRSEDRVGERLLVAYAPGDMPTVCAPGSAKKVPKGALLLFQMHYTPNGKAQADRSSVALVFANEPPRHEVRTRGIMNSRIAIPPNEANYEIASQSTFPSDVLLLSLMPHMHVRGKDFKYEAVFPGGGRETLLSVPRYDFNWQSVYRLAEPRRLPAGTRIECTAHFDNSPGNKNNPDPSKRVTWGDQTWEEMMIGFVDYAILSAEKK